MAITIQKPEWTNKRANPRVALRHFVQSYVEQDFLCTFRFLDTGVPG